MLMRVSAISCSPCFDLRIQLVDALHQNVKLLLDNINLALQLVAVGALFAYVITQFFKAFVVFFLLLFRVRQAEILSP